MVFRFVFLFFVLFALSCSGDSSEPKSTESSEEEDVTVEDIIKTIGEYGRWNLKGFITDPIEETKDYFIITYSDHFGELELIVSCQGYILIKPQIRRHVKQPYLNYQSSSKSNLAYALRVKWGSGTDKRIDKMWAKCERGTDCQHLSLYPYEAIKENELLTAFSDENQLVEVAPSLREPMTNYDKLMLGVEIIQNGSEHLRHYTFELEGFAEAHGALLAKEGCKPIPPLTAATNASFHIIGDADWKSAVGQ